MDTVRWLLILLLINGLAPGVAEAAEAVVHYVETGHLAHSPGEDDLGDQGPEHSCGTVFHQCGCCSAMAVTPHERRDAGVALAPAAEAAPQPPWRLASRSLEPPFRPPII